MISFILKIEKWKWNKDYQIYVSNLGNFKNKSKKDISCLVSPNGYLKVTTSQGLKSAHRIVLETFEPVKNSNLLTVDHINHNKRDNAVNNLEWVTQAENERRAKADFADVSDEVLYIPLIELSKEVEQKKTFNELQIVMGKGKNRKIFSSLESACSFIANQNNCSMENARNKILAAIKDNNTMYCGRKWSII